MQPLSIFPVLIRRSAVQTLPPIEGCIWNDPVQSIRCNSQSDNCLPLFLRVFANHSPFHRHIVRSDGIAADRKTLSCNLTFYSATRQQRRTTYPLAIRDACLSLISCRPTAIGRTARCRCDVPLGWHCTWCRHRDDPKRHRTPCRRQNRAIGRLLFRSLCWERCYRRWWWWLEYGCKKTNLSTVDFIRFIRKQLVFMSGSMREIRNNMY